MADRFDYYRILQIDPGAEPEVVEAAYRRLAVKYHPDHDPSADAGERMKLINEAWECLKDPAKRAVYDSTRGSFDSAGGRRPHRYAPWLRYLAPLLFLGLTIGGFRVSPRVGLIMAIAFVFYSFLRRFRP